jgi:hypothetical protein
MHAMNFLSGMNHPLKKNLVLWISLAGSLLLHLIIAWQPLSRLEFYPLLYSNGPLLDDSYIFFKMSKDLADWLFGFYPSFQLTSGFQPLIALFFLPFFELFWNQKEIAIKLALSLNALLGFCANILLYRLLRWVFSRPIATFLVSVWVWSPYVMNQTINGMETTLAFLLLLLIFNYYWHVNHTGSFKARSWVILGVLLGAGFWARVDLGLLGIAIVLDQLWIMATNSQSSRTLRVRNICLCSIVALCLASPWIVFTIINTGNILPVSGRAVHFITSTFIDFYHQNRSGFSPIMFSYFKKEFLIYQPLAVLSTHTLWQLTLAGSCLIGFCTALLNRKFRTLFRSVWIFQTIMIIAYIVFIGGFWHLNRYFYPVYTFILLLHGASLHWLESKLKLKPLIIGIVLFILFIPYGIIYGLQYTSQWTKPRPPRYLSIARFAKDHIPQNARVGAFQSGCVSCWLDNKVVNLDGLINEEAYAHLKNKTMDVYLANQKIDYLVEEVVLFNMWDEYLGGKLSRDYSIIKRKKEKLLPRLWQESAIYKRKTGE